ncbi:MAG: hypothetical protein JWN48_5979 [Myxococcaceae bacterium]|nr:hypothetical protein [Myxococcaceae bacterium]
MGIVHSQGFRPYLYRESPWYWPIAALLARFDGLSRFPTQDELSALYAERAAALQLPNLTFVAAKKSRKKRPRSEPIDPTELYEGRVLSRAEVPTRSDDWHDLFNALSFVAFPRAKRALHARQYRIITSRLSPSATRLPNARTREQDALSIFDEGGICIAAPHALASAMHEVDDPTLRAALQRGQVRVIPFGHALYEHLVAGLPCPFGAAHVVSLSEAQLQSSVLLDEVDLALGQALEDPGLFQLPSPARGNSLTALIP